MGCMIFTCSVFLEIARVFSRVDISFYISTNHIKMIQFLIIIALILVLAPFFILVILVAM